MEFRQCALCGENAIIWDLERYAGGYRHKNGMCVTTSSATTTRLKRPPTHDESAADAVEAASTHKHEANEVRGFDRPEDGSAQRYVARRSARPWVAHTFWWVVHNAVSHLLIGLVPIKPFFRFHDWTSRKMHGR